MERDAERRDPRLFGGDRRPDNVGQIDWPVGLVVRTTRERHEILDDPPSAHGLGVDDDQRVLVLGTQRPRIDQFGEPADRGQRVIELVGKAGHELAHTGEPFAPPHELFAPQPLRDRLDDGLDPTDSTGVAIGYGLHREPDGDRRTGARAPAHFGRLGESPGDGIGDQRRALGRVAVDRRPMSTASRASADS